MLYDGARNLCDTKLPNYTITVQRTLTSKLKPFNEYTLYWLNGHTPAL